MSKAKTYLIPTHKVYELVAPHDPTEVLKALKGLKLIERFKIGLKHVEIQSKAQARFEMALHLEAETSAGPLDKPLKRTV